MNVAIIGTSRKENERRVAIHPEQIKNIAKNIRTHLFFEKGYGIPFGIADDEIAFLTGNKLLNRKTLFKNFSAFIIPKPVEEDFNEMQEGSIVWGWIHSVQQSNIAQIAIDKKLTLVTWENMYHQGSRNRIHVFQRNNELAGYCGVQHALQLRGIDGNFGAPRSAVILGFGSASRGSIYALMRHGFYDITVLTRRPANLVSDKIPGIRYKQFIKNTNGYFEVYDSNGEIKPLTEELTHAGIIVNGVLQDPNNPIVFIHDNDVKKFQKECIIIDISCDDQMGFAFAHPTSLSNPIFKVGNILYYAMDHTPTLLWDSASWEISNALIPFLKDFVEQTDNAVLTGAIDIKNGIINNKNILTSQNRSPIYPYYRKKKIISQNSYSKEISNKNVRVHKAKLIKKQVALSSISANIHQQSDMKLL